MTQSYVMDLRQDVQLDAAAQQAGINPGNQGNIWYFSYWTNNHQSNNRPPTSTDIISTIMKYKISIFDFCNIFLVNLTFMIHDSLQNRYSVTFNFFISKKQTNGMKSLLISERWLGKRETLTNYLVFQNHKSNSFLYNIKHFLIEFYWPVVRNKISWIILLTVWIKEYGSKNQSAKQCHYYGGYGCYSVLCNNLFDNWLWLFQSPFIKNTI